MAKLSDSCSQNKTCGCQVKQGRLLRLPSDNVVARVDRQDVTVAPSEGEEKVSEGSPASCLHWRFTIDNLCICEVKCDGNLKRQNKSPI